MKAHLGRYRLDTQLGPGGPAQIWSAWLVRADGELDRRVTLKVVRLADDAAARRLRTEYAARQRIQDKRHVVEFLELFEDAESRCVCLVMEHFRGGVTLRRLVHARPAGGGEGALDVQEAAELLRQACLGLRAVHRAGLLHGDLRPESLLIKEIEHHEWHLSIGSLGSASTFRGSEGGDDISAHTSPAIPRYCPPEAWTNRSDPKSDVYALGFAFYELFAGRTAFEEAFAAQLRVADDADRGGAWQRWHTDPALEARPLQELCPACPAALAGLVGSMIRKDPAARAGLDDVLAALGHGAAPSQARAARPETVAEDGGTVWAGGRRARPAAAPSAGGSAREAPSPGLCVTHLGHSRLAGRVERFDAARIEFGRAAECQVRFDPHEDRLVSARHAAATLREGRVHLEDLGSKNGTWVNGRPVRGSVVVAPGDVVRLGQGGPEFLLAAGGGGAGTPPRAADAPAAPPRERSAAPEGRDGPVVTMRRRQRSPLVLTAIVVGILTAALLGLAAAGVIGDGAETPAARTGSR